MDAAQDQQSAAVEFHEARAGLLGQQGVDDQRIEIVQLVLDPCAGVGVTSVEMHPGQGVLAGVGRGVFDGQAIAETIAPDARGVEYGVGLRHWPGPRASCPRARIRQVGTDVEIALRERDLDPRLPELAPDFEHHVALRPPPAFDHIADPEIEQEVDRTVTEAAKETDRFGILQATRMLAGRFQQDIVDLPEIGPVGHPDGNLDAGPGARQRPVGDLVGDEVLVGDEDFLAVEGLDQGEAGTRPPDETAGPVGQLDQVVLFHRTLQQQDEAADEVRGDLLQAEAEAYAQRTAEDGERRQVQADHVEGDQAGKNVDRDLEHLGDQDARGRAHAVEPAQPLLDEIGQDRRRPEHQGQYEAAAEQRIGADAHVADLVAQRVGVEMLADDLEMAGEAGGHDGGQGDEDQDAGPEA